MTMNQSHQILRPLWRKIKSQIDRKKLVLLHCFLNGPKALDSMSRDSPSENLVHVEGHFFYN
ncbi:hypothetical protein KXX12_008318, partial [Aspergillus fumigatus]